MRTILQAVRLAGLLASALLAFGCATTQPLSDESRATVKTVKINDEVRKSSSMYYLGPDSAGEVLQEQAEKNGILIEKIALEEIRAAFRDSGKLKVLDGGEAGDATMHIQVTFYGFSIRHGFSSTLVPVLTIRCEMTNAAGKPVWSATGAVQIPQNPAVPMTLHEMRDKPQRMGEAWRRAAAQIGRKIAYDF